MSLSVGVIGSGAAGLISAHVLKQDGFDVKVITRDSSPGGIWSEERIYPGLALSNVHGEFRFSSLDMPSPPDAPETGGRLCSDDMQAYMATFAETFLKGNITYDTNVIKIYRPVNAEAGWCIDVTKNGEILTWTFDKIVLCTGGCSTPKIPAHLSLAAATNSGFRGPVVHAMDFGPELKNLLAKIRPIHASENQQDTLVVVGGGKSAQDIAAYFANEGRKVTVVFETADAFTAGTKPLPDFIRKSRLLSIFSPSQELPTLLERFLHNTTIGSKIVHGMWDSIQRDSYAAFDIPVDSPLRNSYSAFWSTRVNDEGVKRDNHFFSLVNTGKIELVAPARVTGYGTDGESVTLNNGTSIKASAVVLATGYDSSWSSIFDEATAVELGINRHPPPVPDIDEWNYVSLRNPPQALPGTEQWAASIYRGIVPANNILRKDFAINGVVVTTNRGYVYEVQAHWISSYFLNDEMRLPSSVDDAKTQADRYAAWTRKRWPDQLLWLSESNSAAVHFFSWPQYVDQLLDDMHLPCMRSGGNWLTWPFRIVGLQEIAQLKEEREGLRRK